MKIIAGKHLSVKAEFNLFVAVYIDRLGLAVDEMLAGFGVVQMLACRINGEQSKESHQSGSLAVTHLDQTVIILGAG